MTEGNSDTDSYSHSSGRWLLVTGGVLSFCAALLVVVAPGGRGLDWPWHDELVLVSSFTVMFVLACLLVPFILFDEPDRTGRMKQRGRMSRTGQTKGRPESVPPTPTPGRDFERVLDRRWPTVLLPARSDRMRAQFRQAVVRTLVRTTGCAAEAARGQLERGTWTDDPVAAAFVRPKSETASSPLRSVARRVRFSRDARRTAQAIRALAAERGEDRAGGRSWSRDQVRGRSQVRSRDRNRGRVQNRDRSRGQVREQERR
ncbi:DUF7269 family protein [Natrialba sp. SSL1]|uniref:DUF7269 family protein n=1 Tax=Natrialba sp. SSL1 TaxID=1869245 RepID=UPI0008F90224|nr:hypothetical protein [Natrialba sp. SSL1]OIB58080.1 hypothetical protein BBD46_10490 [Natrialba sp. SSL1]